MVSCECFVMLVILNGALSAITSSPGIRRVYVGDSCTFQWTFSGPVSSYYCENLTTTSPTAVRGTPGINRATGVITLTITNVALWDAGNYSLNIDDANDTTALLYIYQIPRTPDIYADGYIRQFPVVEQKSVWFSCSTGINSRPSNYAPQILYTFQRDGEQISSQLNRHNISGNRVIIDPVLREDHGRLYRCKAQEVGSKLESNYSAVFNLTLHEFKRVPLEFQRKNEQDDFSLTWELSYNICNFLPSGFSFWSFYVELFHSKYRTIATLSLSKFLYDCQRYLSLDSSYITRASFTADNSSITFYLANVLTSDAGNFTLTLYYDLGSSVQYSTAALFVYGYPSVRIIMSPDMIFVPIGYSVELICTANSTSLPAAYRPAMVYSWGRHDTDHVGLFQVRAEGSVALEDGTVVDRYTLTKNNRTLRIASVNFIDNKAFYCIATELGSNKNTYMNIYLNTVYAPVIVSATPFSRKVNVIAPKKVRLGVNFVANPWPDTIPSWRFVDINGVSQSLPLGTVTGWYYMQFILSSLSQYGSYTCRVNNTNGATEITFQVLPPAKPDKPTDFRANYLTPESIFLQWNCSWDNGLQQFFIVQLKETTRSTVIETKNITSPIGCLSNVTFRVKFESNIQPKTDYEASLWSSNDLGLSDIVGLTVRTPTKPTLLVSSENIILSRTNATISFSIVQGKAVQLKVECCVESVQICIGSYFNVSGEEGRITLVNIPTNGSQYTFDFYLYDGPAQSYSLVAFVRNVLIDKDAVTAENKGASNNSLLPAVIVLAILLGLSIVLVGLLIAFLINRRSKTPTQRTTQQLGTRQNDYAASDGVVIQQWWIQRLRQMRLRRSMKVWQNAKDAKNRSK